MSTDDHNEIYRSLGNIEAGIETLKQQVGTLVPLSPRVTRLEVIVSLAGVILGGAWALLLTLL